MHLVHVLITFPLTYLMGAKMCSQVPQLYPQNSHVMFLNELKLLKIQRTSTCSLFPAVEKRQEIRVLYIKQVIKREVKHLCEVPNWESLQGQSFKANGVYKLSYSQDIETLEADDKYPQFHIQQASGICWWLVTRDTAWQDGTTAPQPGIHHKCTAIDPLSYNTAL